MDEETLPDVLVSTEWLQARLEDPDLRIFDCSTRLNPADAGEGVPYHPEPLREAYRAAHIPGAAFLDVPGELSLADAPVHFMMPAFDEFARTMGGHGVGRGTRVVLYSTGTPMWACRVWWMLRAAGFDDAAVLDGGLDAWLAEGRPVERGSKRYPPATFEARPRPDLLIDRNDVQELLGDPAALLVNTLSARDFKGAEEDSRYGRPGRIPGSVNAPWVEMLDPDMHLFLDQDELCRRFEALGAAEAERVVCYCGGGISATMALLQLHRLGYHDLALYDASMAEWAKDDDLPIEQG